MKYPNTNKTLTYVNHPVMKKDAMALVTGKPVYTDDIAPGDCLCVKLLRSPHAHAMIREIHTETAMKVPGIVCILTYKDVPHRRFTMAGQTYPEESPYDRYILDAHVRFCGDPVAIIAGENEQAVDRAKKLIKVTYDVLEPVLISIPQRTILYWCIRKRTGTVLWKAATQITSAICAPLFPVPGEIPKALWRTVILFWRRPTIRPPASSP